MSITLYGQDRFQRIACTLITKKSSTFVELSLNIPLTTIEDEIWSIMDEIYRANQLAYNRQYPNDQESLRTLTVGKREGYASRTELLKAMQGVRFNLHDSSGRISDVANAYEKFNRIIYNLMFEIIRITDEYGEAKTW